MLLPFLFYKICHLILNYLNLDHDFSEETNEQDFICF